MSIREILESVQRSDVGDWNEINTSLLAIKDELMRVINGINYIPKSYREQIEDAITKLCEEGK